ncbi:pyridoxamine 5'-phosphate oxidase family protein [Psychrobacter sp. HD31]|uniref:pyridoxamine 5'-phosphate oxidase family protein n=1 Tax=Psychrobacter sp. HD31 TaxID=3112003 RepID=UPI003DA5556D
MSIQENWQKVKKVLEEGQASTIYCSIATVNPDGSPHITPVGTVFLRDDLTGYFFDHYAVKMGENIDSNPNICIMAVNAGRMFWLRSLIKGKFVSHPGVRLYGKAGPVRPATKEEIKKIEDRVKPTKWLKGAGLLWTDFTHVRDVDFSDYKPITYPVMMDGMW